MPGAGASAGSETSGNSGRYVGRVGALAVALGVGFAIATGQGLGVARADDLGGNDDAGAASSTTGESAPSAPAAPDVQPASPSPSDGPSGGAGDPKPEPPTGEMKVSSSGGADTSANDEGQSTDTGAGVGDVDVDEDEDEDESDDAPAVVQPDTSAPEPSTTPVADDRSKSELAPPQRDSPSVSAVVVRRAATEAAPPEPPATEPEPAATQPVVARLSAAPMDDVVEPGPADDVTATLAQAPGAPAAPTGTLVDVASSFVALLLSPFVAPGPTSPAQPPLLWAVLSWVRREVHRTFFNHTPTAVADEVGTSEDVATTIDVAGNDADDDADVTVTSVTQPANGTAVLNSDGTVTYTPNADFYGTDTFSYTITDASSPFHFHGLLGLLTGKGHTATGTVTVTVDPVNDGAPVANPDSAEVDEGGSVVVAVLANDTDPDGNSTIDPDSVEVTQPAHGTVTVNADGTVTYQSNGDEVTSDSFTYIVKDDLGASSGTGTVTVTIHPVNDAPVAVDDTLEVNEGGTRSIRPFLNDTDAEGDSTIVGPTLEITQQPAHGVATLNPNGSVTYRSTGGPASTDSFTYTVRDSDGAVSNTGTVNININHAPVSVPDRVTTTRDTPITIAVLANDSDPDGDTLSILSTTINSTQGSVALGTNTVVYAPPPGQTGEFTFYYDAWDSKGFQGNSASVTVIVIDPTD